MGEIINGIAIIIIILLGYAILRFVILWGIYGLGKIISFIGMVSIKVFTVLKPVIIVILILAIIKIIYNLF